VSSNISEGELLNKPDCGNTAMHCNEVYNLQFGT